MKFKRLPVILLVLCVIAAGLAGLYVLSIPSLLRRSTRITSTAAWCLAHPRADHLITNHFELGSNYAWISEEDLLFLTAVRMPSVPIAVKGTKFSLTAAYVTLLPEGPIYKQKTRNEPYNGLYPYGGNICSYNMPTKTTHTLDRITKIFNKTNGIANTIHVSSDGKWIDWDTINRIFIASLNDSRTYSESDQQNRYWCKSSSLLSVADTKNDIAITGALHASICDLDSRQRINNLRVFESRDAIGSKTTLVSPTLNLLTTAWSGDTSIHAAVSVYVSPIKTYIEMLNEFTICLPADSEIRSMAFSPSGDRIAWLLTQHKHSSLFAWLHRHFTSFRDTEQLTTGIWVSNIDGSHMLEIGTIAPKQHGQFVDEPYLVRWLPSGKKLSFVYKDWLYTVPVTSY